MQDVLQHADAPEAILHRLHRKPHLRLSCFPAAAAESLLMGGCSARRRSGTCWRAGRTRRSVTPAAGRPTCWPRTRACATPSAGEPEPVHICLLRTSYCNGTDCCAAGMAVCRQESAQAPAPPWPFHSSTRPVSQAHGSAPRAVGLQPGGHPQRADRRDGAAPGGTRGARLHGRPHCLNVLLLASAILSDGLRHVCLDALSVGAGFPDMHLVPNCSRS